MNRIFLALALVAAVGMTGTAGAVEVVWDGGDGAWNSASWNGGQTANDVFGRMDGHYGGFDVTIGGGATVTYDQDTIGDFEIRQSDGPGGLTITGGATFFQTTADHDVDGQWTEYDGSYLNIDGGTFSRTLTTGFIAETGGALIFGSWNGTPDTTIAVNITNGGRLENDGQVWFGAPSDTKSGITAIVTINQGDVDLTGGINLELENDDLIAIEADLMFSYGWDFGAGAPNGETYAVNFTGPGTFTVDEGGIIAAVQDQFGFWTNLIGGGGGGTDLVTYQDLWDVGILQANGLSGLDGETFTDFFSFSGTPGLDDYILTSLIVADPHNNADFDHNGIVNGDDFLIWQTGFGSAGDHEAGDANEDGVVNGDDFLIWQQQFGGPPPPPGGGSVVPEPAGAFLALIAALAMAFVARRRQA